MHRNELLRALEAVRQPASRANGLPNASYTDPELFRLERDRVFPGAWSGVCFASDLPEPGYALPVEFMGLPLLVVRDREGVIKVFHNVCRHRGMKLVHEAAPLRTVVRCPYHSWAYDLDGRLVSTPHIGGAERHSCEGFDKADHGLRPVRSGIWMDVVFANLSGAAEPFEDFVRPVRERWEAFTGHGGFDLLRTPAAGATMDLSVNCNWKLAVENYCEAYHLPWVHPALNSYSPLSEHYNITVDDSLSGQGSLNYRLASVSSEALPKFPAWPAERLHNAEYLSLYPNVLLGVQADHAFAMIVQPQSESRSVERLQLSFVGDSALEDRFEPCRDAVLQSWKVVFGEDVFAVESMQSGRSSPGFDGGVFTPVQDIPTHHFHCWVATRYMQSLADAGA